MYMYNECFYASNIEDQFIDELEFQSKNYMILYMSGKIIYSKTLKKWLVFMMQYLIMSSKAYTYDIVNGPTSNMIDPSLYQKSQWYVYNFKLNEILHKN